MTRAPDRRCGALAERGAALVLVLLMTMLLAALGAALVTLAVTETRIAANFRDGEEARYAADAALGRVLDDLRRVPRWDDVLGGIVSSGFTDSSPPVPLDGLTARLQDASDASARRGPDNPLWRLYAWGAASDLLPKGPASGLYVAVWLADDPAETDGNPLADTNGLLVLHSEALGPGGTSRATEATIARPLALNLHIRPPPDEAIVNLESGLAGVSSQSLRIVAWRQVR